MQTCSACGNYCPDDAPRCLRCQNRLTGHSGFGRDLQEPDTETPQELDLTGLQLQGRYHVTRRLGSGGMGAVFAATDTRLSRSVALKVLSPELVAHPTARARMAQEARALARIEHRNVVRVFDVFDEGQLLVLVLELVTGGDLGQHMRRSGLLPPAQAAALMGDLLAGLAAVHAAGLVHRDIKPENVLLDAQGVPKLTDLGVARDAQSGQRTQLGVRLGTPAYMSPEQAQGLTVDVQSDLYSAALVFYEMLTGKLPFAGASDFDVLAARVQREPDLSALATSAHKFLPLLVKALARDPAARFASADAMRAALSGAPVVPQSLVPPTSAPTQQPTAKKPSGPVPEWMNELQRFADLHRKGILTDAEFAEQKRRLLNRG